MSEMVDAVVVKSEEVRPVHLRTPDEITAGAEWVFAQQKAGTLDSKRANGMNATLKSVIKLSYDLSAKLLEITQKYNLKAHALPGNVVAMIGEFLPGNAALPEPEQKALPEAAEQTEAQ
jgi:hypothetical protein